jgi:hypothetical protein
MAIYTMLAVSIRATQLEYKIITNHVLDSQISEEHVCATY